MSFVRRPPGNTYGVISEWADDLKYGGMGTIPHFCSVQRQASGRGNWLREWRGRGDLGERLTG